jgi:polyferredoxin
MKSIKFPTGLIRYSSEHALKGEKSSLIKAKNIGYAVTMLVAIVLLVWSVANQSDVEMLVQQVRQPLSVNLSDGRVQNRYNIKINNKTTKAVKYRISIEGLIDAELDLGKFTEVNVPAEHSVKVTANVRISPANVKNSRTKFNFVINSLNSKVKQKVIQQNVFYVPQKQLRNK